MATTSKPTESSKKEQARLPPKRGLIKIRVLASIAKAVVRVASKAGRGLSRKKKKVTTEETQPPLPYGSKNMKGIVISKLKLEVRKAAPVNLLNQA